MKRFRLLLVLAPLLLAFQCDDDRYVTANAIPTGSWELRTVTGGIAGVNYEFEEGAVIWTFNIDMTVDVVNNNTNEEAVDFFETGSYSFTYVPAGTESSCSHTTIINEMDFGCQNIAQDVLTYTLVETDGYLLTFRKN